MYSRNRFIIFTGVILCFVCLPPIEAQDDTSRAITSLLEASQLIDQNNKLNPVKAIGVAWSNVPVAVKSDPDALYCYALVRMKHDVDSFSILSRLAIIAPENSDFKKSHIYSAFKEKGGVIACTLINKYVRQDLTNEKESEFTLWAVVMIETISRDEKIYLKLKALLASPAYVAFKQNNQELKPLLEKLGIKFDEQQFNIAKSLDQQITEAKQILKNTTEPYLKTRELLVKAITLNLRQIGSQLSPVSVRTFTYRLSPITTQYGWKADTTYSICPNPFLGHLNFNDGSYRFTRVYDIYSGAMVVFQTELLDPAGRFGLYYQSIARLQPIITEGRNLRTRLSQLDLNMQFFLRNFTLKYKEAIKTDAELSLAMNTWRQRMQQYNAQFAAIAKLDKKQQSQENRTLKFLAEKLLPLIDFSAEKELEKFQVMQP